jgi:hypothetical protein
MVRLDDKAQAHVRERYQQICCAPGCLICLDEVAWAKTARLLIIGCVPIVAHFEFLCDYASAQNIANLDIGMTPIPLKFD